MKPNKKQELNDSIKNLAKRCKLETWNSFIEELQVPSELVPALLTARPQLIKLAKPRPLTAEEAEALYKLVGGLLETNMALREHAVHLSQMVGNWVGSIHGFIGVADRISCFAEFRHEDAAADDETGE